MIFGFNTDIKQGDTVYHVQSEARESELLLQTQVFVRGRCIGKRATPYGDKLAGGFTDQQKEHGLRDQHRLVLDAIRDGRLDDVLDKRETPETLAAIKELGAAAVKEPGCRQLSIAVSQKDPNHVLLFEAWDNAATFDAFLATDLFKKYQATVGSMIAKRDIRTYSSVAMNFKGN